MLNATKETFAESTAEGLVLVDFWAAWCGPCRMLAPVLKALDEETILSVVKIDIDANPELAEEYEVMSVPTMILFKDGKPVQTIVGAKPRKAILDEIQDHLN